MRSAVDDSHRWRSHDALSNTSSDSRRHPDNRHECLGGQRGDPMGRAGAPDRPRDGNGSQAPRLYAMVTVAMYDAVNGIDRARHLSTREHALVSVPGAPAFGDRRAAAAAAAHAVLKSFVPEGSAQASALDAALTAELESLARAPQAVVDAGRAWGAAVGEAVIAARANDNTQTPETKPAGTGVYVYRADFAGAEFRSMFPFGIESIDPYVATNLPDSRE